MLQAESANEQEGDFKDETCNQCIEKITYLRELIEIEEAKLFKAMRNTAKLKRHS